MINSWQVRNYGKKGCSKMTRCWTFSYFSALVDKLFPATVFGLNFSYCTARVDLFFRM